MNTDRRARLRELLCAADDAVSQRRKIARMIADCEEMTPASPLIAHLAAAVAREAAATAALPGEAVAAECRADGAPEPPVGPTIHAGYTEDRDAVLRAPPAETPRPNPAAASADASATASPTAAPAAPPTPEPPAKRPRQRRKKAEPALLTAQEAEDAYNAAPAEPLSEERLQEIVEYATAPRPPVPVWPVKGGYAFSDPGGIELAASCGVGATFAAGEFVDVAERLLEAGRELLVVEPLDAPPRADAPADLLFDPADYATHPTAQEGGL